MCLDRDRVRIRHFRYSYLLCTSDRGMSQIMHGSVLHDTGYYELHNESLASVCSLSYHRVKNHTLFTLGVIGGAS